MKAEKTTSDNSDEKGASVSEAEVVQRLHESDKAD